MANNESLDDLIEGLAGAVVEAQRRIETHQIENFLSFFDEDRRPKKLDILVPSLHPEAQGEDVRYRVPLLPLVASSLLRIKEVEISFDTELVGVSEPSEIKEGEKSTGKDQTQSASTSGIASGSVDKLKSIALDIRGSGVFRKKPGTAHVVMKVEGKEISEGMARLVDRLVQIQGDIEPTGNK